MPWGSLAGYRSPSLRQETTEERKRESGTEEMNDIFLMENVCHRKKRRCAGEGGRDRERDKRRADWKHPQTQEATKLKSTTRRDEDGGDRCVQ